MLITEPQNTLPEVWRGLETTLVEHEILSIEMSRAANSPNMNFEIVFMNKETGLYQRLLLSALEFGWIEKYWGPVLKVYREERGG